MFVSFCLPFIAQAAGLTTPAEYIIGFVRYVHWAGAERAADWQICVVASAPRDSDRAYAGQLAHGKPFVVRYISRDDGIATCHVLDLTQADAASAAALLQRARHLPILTVGSGPNFCSLGGVLCLRLGDPEQKFEINLSAVKESHLNISARLLMLGSSRSGATEGR